MCLYEILCDYVGAIQFDIEFLALNLFVHIHILLILTVLFHYLEVPVDSYASI